MCLLRGPTLCQWSVFPSKYIHFLPITSPPNSFLTKRDLEFTRSTLAKPARRIQEASASPLPCASVAASLSAITLPPSVAPFLPHSYLPLLPLTPLDSGEKKPSRHFPPFLPGLPLLTVHARRECRGKLPAVLSGSSGRNHRLFALWVCLFYHLINCYQVQLCENMKYSFT